MAGMAAEKKSASQNSPTDITSVASSVVDETALEKDIQAFGQEVFRAMGEEQPSTFSFNNLSGRIMEWSMTKPDFKLNMFRLVDVLPALQNSPAIVQHVNEYLSKPAADIHGLIEWGVNVDPHSMRAKLTAYTVKKAVREMAKMFIAGETPREALKALRRGYKNSLTFTVDLLGEYSVSEKEANAYLERYLDALNVLGKEVPRWSESKPIIEGHPGCITPVNVSVKLSALYSQIGVLNFSRSVDVLTERLSTIVRKASEVNAQIYVDAEDTGYNPIIYETFKRVFGSDEFRNFPYPGIVLQAYAKESEQLLSDLIDFARTRGGPIAVRLVKGAYWDQETVHAAQNNWENPLFEHKESTDANYERLSRVLIENADYCLPAFGSHNIRSLAHACCYAKHYGLTHKQFEIQALWGMAEPIARTFAKKDYLVRMYVPLGKMLPGMGYLVRRLLENTSNESFLKHTFYDAAEVSDLLRRPCFVA